MNSEQENIYKKNDGCYYLLLVFAIEKLSKGQQSLLVITFWHVANKTFCFFPPFLGKGNSKD